MYIPSAFQGQDVEEAFAFIRKQSFAVLFSQDESGPQATHLPLLLEEKAEGGACLLGHFARANPHWKHLGERALAIFSGPHAFIDSAWYEKPNTVPTWNYIAVQVTVKPVLCEVGETEALIDKMMKAYSAQGAGWKQSLDAAILEGLLTQIVGVKFFIESLEGKWKLSQNRPLDQQKKVIASLLRQADAGARAIAEEMEARLPADSRL